MKIERSIDKITENLLQENERNANRFLCIAAIILAAVYPISWVITFWGYKTDYVFQATLSYAIAVAILLVMFFVGKKLNYEGEWMKNLLMIGMILAFSPIMIMNVYNAWYLAILPILMACRYFDSSFLIITAIISTVVTICSQIMGAYVGFATGYYDLMAIANIPEGTDLTVHGTIGQTLIDGGYITLKDLVMYPIDYMPAQVIILACFTAAGYAIAKSGRRMVMKQAEIMNDKTQMEIRSAEENAIRSDNRNRLMRSQVQPHFLFNVLANIGALCRRDGQKAYGAVSDFADYLRLNLDSLTMTGTVPFEEELEHTQKYLKLEKLRFGDDLDVRYDIRFSGFRVPLITLQPLVENAIIHGVCKNNNQGYVIIRSDLDGNDVCITVEDNGIGFDTTKLRTKALQRKGISNVRSRIEGLCGGSIQVTSQEGKGTVVTIRIPMEQEL